MADDNAKLAASSRECAKVIGPKEFGRLGQAEDLAPMALAVLSNRISTYVTGAAIVVDGGLSLTNWFEPPDLGEF